MEQRPSQPLLVVAMEENGEPLSCAGAPCLCKKKQRGPWPVVVPGCHGEIWGTWLWLHQHRLFIGRAEKPAGRASATATLLIGLRTNF